MDSITDDDLQRLPARFRRYIEGLRTRVRELERAREAQEPTRIIIDPYGASRYVNERLDVRFMLNDRQRIDCALRSVFASDPDSGRASLCLNASEEINVIPSASNQVYITTRC